MGRGFAASGRERRGLGSCLPVGTARHAFVSEKYSNFIIRLSMKKLLQTDAEKEKIDSPANAGTEKSTEPPGERIG